MFENLLVYFPLTHVLIDLDRKRIEEKSLIHEKTQGVILDPHSITLFYIFETTKEVVGTVTSRRTPLTD
jgi:hypothetical protein